LSDRLIALPIPRVPPVTSAVFVMVASLNFVHQTCHHRDFRSLPFYDLRNFNP